MKNMMGKCLLSIYARNWLNVIINKHSSMQRLPGIRSTKPGVCGSLSDAFTIAYDGFPGSPDWLKFYSTDGGRVSNSVLSPGLKVEALLKTSGMDLPSRASLGWRMG